MSLFSQNKRNDNIDYAISLFFSHCEEMKIYLFLNLFINLQLYVYLFFLYIFSKHE